MFHSEIPDSVSVSRKPGFCTNSPGKKHTQAIPARNPARRSTAPNLFSCCPNRFQKDIAFPVFIFLTAPA